MSSAEEEVVVVSRMNRSEAQEELAAIEEGFADAIADGVEPHESAVRLRAAYREALSAPKPVEGWMCPGSKTLLVHGDRFVDNSDGNEYCKRGYRRRDQHERVLIVALEK